MPGADLLLVGRVARRHGNRGEVIVNPESDFADRRFTVGTVLLVGPAASATPRAIESVRFHQGRPILVLAGIDTMNDAEALAGFDLWMPESAIEPLPDGTYYRHDLVGCVVEDLAGRLIGPVSAVEGPIDRSLLVVAGPGGDVMIPMVGQLCVLVDTAARRIVVDPPEGLIELNAASAKARAAE